MLFIPLVLHSLLKQEYLSWVHYHSLLSYLVDIIFFIQTTFVGKIFTLKIECRQVLNIDQNVVV